MREVNRRADDMPETLFVFGWWLALAVALVGYVAAFGSNLPTGDDFELVPVLSGAQPFTLAWLWEPLNEHRLPVGKLALYLFASLSGGDYRAAMYGSTVLLSLVTLAGLRAVRFERGRSEYTDAFIPLVVLHWGHRANIIWNIQFFFVAAAAVSCAIGFTILRGRFRTSPRSAWLLGLLIAILPLQGGMGLAATPAFTLWAMVVGWSARRSPDPGRRHCGAALMAGAAAAVVLALFYVAGDVPLLTGAGSFSLYAVASSTLRCLSMGLGPPPMLRFWPLPALVIAVLGVASAVRLVGVMRRWPEERVRAAGLLTTLVGAGAVSFGVGLGRSHLGPLGPMATRYSVIAMLLPAMAYLAWVIRPAARTGRVVPMLLLTAALVALGNNVPDGYRYGVARLRQAALVEADIRAGLTVDEVAGRHESLFFDPQRRAEGLRMLEASRRGPYRRR